MAYQYMVIVKTRRLLLRELTTADAPFMLRLLNSPGWLQYIGDRNVYNVEQAEGYILSGPVDSYRRFQFGLYVVEVEAVPIGVCGLINRDNLHDVDLGFALLPQYAGKGYAYEAANCTMLFARDMLFLERLIAITQIGNDRSIGLLQKLGFRYEQTILETGKTTALKLFGIDLDLWDAPDDLIVAWP